MMDQVLNLNSETTARVIETSPSSRPVYGLEGFEHRFETVGGVMDEITAKSRADFDASVALLEATALRRESTLYATLRDVFGDVLGHLLAHSS